MSFSSEFTHRHGPLRGTIARFAQLLEPKTGPELEAMAQEAHRLTRQHFGRTIRMFAPIYLSNECVNNCKYCGFSRDNPILRVTLTVDQMEQEARYLLNEGFRSILLVAGEHPKFVSNQYLRDCVARLRPHTPSIGIEVGPMEAEEYEPIVRAGAEYLIVFQETYNPEVYEELHVFGPKKNYAWRLDCPERGYAAGFRRLGIGALFGLAPWREEALHLAMHAEYLLKNCWKSFLNVTLPRLRPAAGGFAPRYDFTDRDMVQTMCAFRICFPEIGITQSTRERADFRDSLMQIGVTMISAASRTEPGGYTGVARDRLHQTKKGIRQAPIEHVTADTNAEEQFHIADPRSVDEVVAKLRTMGLEPVWKDWDQSIQNLPASEPAAAGV
jgi:2-iminoacetate synthase